MITSSPSTDQLSHNPALALLDRVGRNERSGLYKFFLDAVRKAGMQSPEAVVEYVLEVLSQRIARLRTQITDEGVPVQPVRFYRITLAHPAEALALATDAFRTPEERAQGTAAREEFYRRAWMDAQPTTDRQRAYLRSLGHRGAVQSRGEASRLIDALVREGA